MGTRKWPDVATFEANLTLSGGWGRARREEKEEDNIALGMRKGKHRAAVH